MSSIQSTSSEVSAPQALEAGSYQIDPAHTVVEFTIKHLMISTVKGRFGTVSGEISIDTSEPARSSVTVTIDASSIDTREPQRDAHLRSPDFFDVERFPTITFRSRKIEPSDRDSTYRVIGDLTIRDVTREVAFDATYLGKAIDPWGNTKVGFAAETALNRRDFGLNWNVALEAGGFLVGDSVKINLEVQAAKQR